MLQLAAWRHQTAGRVLSLKATYVRNYTFSARHQSAALPANDAATQHGPPSNTSCPTSTSRPKTVPRRTRFARANCNHLHGPFHNVRARNTRRLPRRRRMGRWQDPPALVGFIPRSVFRATHQARVIRRRSSPSSFHSGGHASHFTDVKSKKQHCATNLGSVTVGKVRWKQFTETCHVYYK